MTDFMLFLFSLHLKEGGPFINRVKVNRKTFNVKTINIIFVSCIRVCDEAP